MRDHLHISRVNWGAAAMLLMASPAAFAGAALNTLTVEYAPFTATNTSAVPTLSSWGLVAMVLLFSVLIYRVLRTKMGSKPLASLVLAGVLGAGGFSGLYTVNPAWASVLFRAVMDDDSGGSAEVSVGYFQGDAELEVSNASGKPQQIKSIENTTGQVTLFENSSTPQCSVGLVLATQQRCFRGIRLGNPS